MVILKIKKERKMEGGIKREGEKGGRERKRGGLSYEE